MLRFPFLLSFRFMRSLAFICLLLAFPFVLLAQSSDKHAGYGIEADLCAGRIIRNNIVFPPIPALSTSLNVAFVQQTDGRKAWQQRRRYPLLGLGLSYTNYGNNDIYGQSIGLYPFIQVPIVRGKNLEWTCRAGLGIGYISKHASRFPDWDTINNISSSHFNNYTLLATDLRYHINKHWDIQAGLTISHISNGELRHPNLGVNLGAGHIGFRYFPVSAKPGHIVKDLPKLKGRWLIQARMGIGFKSMQTMDGPLYPVYMPSLYISKRYASRNKIFAGLDYSYYHNVYAFLQNNEIFPGHEKEHSWEASIFAGNEFLFGRFGILLQFSIPIHHTYLREDKYYQKVGYNFYLVQREQGVLKELCATVLIKANKFQADVFEFGLGVGL